MKGTIAHILAAMCMTELACADPTIQSLQQTLKDQGFYYGNVTGDKSAETTAAIRRYQIRNGLQVTGELDQETLGAIKGSNSTVSWQVSKPAVTPSSSVLAGETSRASQTSPPRLLNEPDRQLNTHPDWSTASYQSAPWRMDTRTLAEVQQQLTIRGYYRGRIDGRHGRSTTVAVRAFQLASGLPPTGRVDVSTLNALGFSNENLASLDPASPRGYEAWAPVTKFKHGKWKVKWTKHRRQGTEQYANEDRSENGDARWDASNRDEYNR